MTDTCHRSVRRCVWVWLCLILTWAAVFVSSQAVPFASNCNFDGELLCGFVQQTVGDDFDWEVGSGAVEALGLSGDHTGGGSYAYFNTTGKTRSQTAILRSMQLASLTPHCLTFYYYMDGADVGSLAVLQQRVGEQQRTELWSVEGDQGHGWKRAKIDVTSPISGNTPMGYRINFDAVVGSGQLGLIAIDDVVFVNGPCDSDGCTVPLGMENGWITDDQITASSADVDFPTSSARLHGNGSWIPSIPQSSWLQVEFATTMILTGIRTQGFRTGWITKYIVEYSETLTSAWITCNAFITTDQLTGNSDADSVVEHLFSGRLQAQRIKVTPLQFHLRPSLRLEIIGCDYGTCTFDSSPCVYIRNSSVADFMWTWKLPTGSEAWGPTSDHTAGAAAGGSFLLADATGRHADDTAILSTEVLPPTPAKCVEFFYHMNSPAVGALNVFLKRDDMPLADAVAMTPAQRLVGQQGDGWRRGGVEVTADFPYEVVFQAVIGQGDIYGYGDIGLDDVTVREGLCPWPEFDDCLNSPCLNNGTCTDGKDNYTCTCGEQFYGRDCEHDIDDCKSAPCHNNGTCIDGDRNYTCICSDAFYGGDCEIAVQCPPLTTPVHGALSPVGENFYQDVVTFTCNQGYELIGASSTTCQVDQTWSDSVPTCTPVQCLTLTAPENGHLSSVGPNYYQDEVTFTCDEGYELNGASSVTCQADQQWSHAIPTCTFAVCAQGETLALTDSVTEGYITSPYYPGNYPINMDCNWTITAPSAIQLDFVGTFDIEYGPTCPYDYVRVFEGQISASSILGTFCGSSLPVPPTVRTVGNVMIVQFHSDYSEQKAGFRAKYSIPIPCPALTAPANGALSSVGPHYHPDVVTVTCNQGYEPVGGSTLTCQADGTWSNAVPTCSHSACLHGENLALTDSVTEGFIFSPNYPDGNYPNNANCLWTISSPLALAVKLEFVDTFEIEFYEGLPCYDYVKVFEGRISPSSALGTFCGTSLPVLPIVRTVGSVMKVQFHTDSDRQHAGFRAKYSIAIPCLSTLTAPTNGDLSPTGPHYYPDVVTFTCNHGYELTGASDLTCLSDQTWSDVVPTCTHTASANGTSAVIGTTDHEASTTTDARTTDVPTTKDARTTDVPTTKDARTTDVPTTKDARTTDVPTTKDARTTDVPTTKDARTTDVPTTTAQHGTVLNVTSVAPETTLMTNSTVPGVPTEKPIVMPSLPLVVEGGGEAFAMLECTGEYMQIVFSRSHLPDFDTGNLHLIDPSCKATGNATHIILTAPFEGCGTVKTDTESEIIYFNKVLSTDNDGVAFITRIRELEVPFECRMDSRDTVSAMFSPQIEKIYFFRSAHGKYNFDMQLFTSAGFQQQIDTFPYVVQLNQPLYVQVQVLTPDQDLQLFAENCMATPSANILDPMSYTFISDGCPVDSTFLSLFSSSQKQERFSINSFAFVEDYPEVYLHCTVMVCNATDPTSRCAQGCLPPPARHKRAAPEAEPRYNVYKGPILNPGYKRPSDVAMDVAEEVEDNRGARVPPGVVTSLVLAVGLLLCAVVTLVGVIAYMRMRTARKELYMALPTDDLE